jgi:hypothetical protein
MSAIKLSTPSSGSISLSPADTASNLTITVPATTATMAINGPAFRVYRNANFTVTNAVNTKVGLDTEIFDTANCFDTTTNRFTPNVAGYYQFNAMIGALSSSSLSYNFIRIYKNGISDSVAIYGSYLGTSSYGSVSALVYLNGTTDYVELYAQLGGVGTLTVIGGSSSESTYMSGCLVRSA